GDKKEITQVTADKDGNYRVTLPPGDYILDVPRRKPGFVRATPQPFTIVSNHTVRVDMHIDTDHSRSNSMHGFRLPSARRQDFVRDWRDVAIRRSHQRRDPQRACARRGSNPQPLAPEANALSS